MRFAVFAVPARRTVPLWRDSMRDCRIEVMEKGVRHDLPLVSRKKRILVDPRRGVRTLINTHFHLPPGLSEYRFPLVQGGQGRQAGELEYDAVLRRRRSSRSAKRQRATGADVRVRS